MEVFLTGASGYVGRHVARELVARGHRVTGMARQSSSRTAALESVEWLFSDLADRAGWSAAVDAADVVIHCAMNYSDQGTENDGLDAAFVEGVQARGKFLVYTGNLYAPREDPALEFPEATLPQAKNWRLEHECRILQGGVPAAVVRLGFVYGGLGGYLWPMLPPESIRGIDAGKIKPSLWPMIHVLDASRLYATVAEKRATGVFHAYDGSKTTARDIVNALLEIYPEEGRGSGAAHDHIHELLSRSIATSNEHSRSLGWKPLHSKFEENAEDAYAQYLKHVGDEG